MRTGETLRLVVFLLMIMSFLVPLSSGANPTFLPFSSLLGVKTASGGDPCLGSPSPGTVCAGGTVFLGTLSPGATSGSGTDRYMTTPSGCGEIPAGQRVVGSFDTSSYGYYPNGFFTPSCSGATDSLKKYWNDGSTNFALVPGLVDYTTTTGTGNGAINTDQNYGSTNTANIAAVTALASGGYHAAARYCQNLDYGGYKDWYLPNRAELNLMWTNRASIPGLDLTGTWYWSSTEYSADSVWFQRFTDGYQIQYYKNFSGGYLVRCVRRY